MVIGREPIGRPGRAALLSFSQRLNRRMVLASLSLGGASMHAVAVRPVVVAVTATIALIAASGAGHAMAPRSGHGSQVDQSENRLVVRRDIDGDGRNDRVYMKNRTDDLSILRVDRAHGHSLRQKVRTEYWEGSPWHGAAKVDGRPGFDLVTGYTSGAHTLFFRAWTYRSGKIVPLDAPGRGRTWVVDGSYSVNIGVSRRSAGNRIFIVTRSAVRDRDGKGHHGRIRTYRWKSNHWVQSSSKKHRWSTKAAYRLGGWHIEGLPRFL